jgi:hypothetical protein
MQWSGEPSACLVIYLNNAGQTKCWKQFYSIVPHWGCGELLLLAVGEQASWIWMLASVYEIAPTISAVI